ncbi:oxygen-independent coproporphyrinogen III oxidase [Rhodocaloribacter sp.]
MPLSHPSPGLTVDLDLIRKYDRPGPRYTSYPTAPHFTEAVGPEDFVASLSKDANRERPLSLYFHLPFCAKLCYFCGCTMVVSHNRGRIRRYVDYLIEEIELLAGLTEGRTVRQIHWGGGTPTHLTPDEIRLLAEATRTHYTIAEDAEISVEIDPREVTEAHFRALREGGFNRISMGVQDFHEPTQQAVNRIQPEALTRRLIALARELGFESLNLDFIYGLPHQTPATFADTVEKLIDIRPDRIALFSYAHVPWMKKHQRVIDASTLPGPQDKLNILKLAIERLTAAGYVFIGMDHFALPEDGLVEALRTRTLYRNFQGYSTYADCDLLGHGMSAISQTDDCYAQNTKDFRTYYDRLDRDRLPTGRGCVLDEDDQLRRTVIMRLMCDFALDFAAIEEAFDLSFESYFSDALAQLTPFIDDGLVRLEDRKLTVTDMGRLLIRNIAMPFDRYLQTNPSARFSKTI